MKRDQKISRLAKKLVLLSKHAEVVTEARTAEVLAGLKQLMPRNYLATLKRYLALLRREVALQNAVVATPGSLSQDALDAIEAKFSELYARSITAVTRKDASLIAGVRVRVGDDVYDASLSGRLQRLAENVQ